MKNMSAVKIATLLVWAVFSSVLAFSDFLYYRNKVATEELDFGFFLLLICLHLSYDLVVLKKILSSIGNSHKTNLVSLLIFVLFVGIFTLGSVSAISGHLYVILMIAFGAALFMAKKLPHLTRISRKWHPSRAKTLMKASAFQSVFAITGCAIFGVAGLYIAAGFAPGHTSLFSRTGGVGFAAFFTWIARRYILQLRRGARLYSHEKS